MGKPVLAAAMGSALLPRPSPRRAAPPAWWWGARPVLGHQQPGG